MVNMQPNERQRLCLAQHGSDPLIQALFEQALFLGDSCLIPNLGIDLGLIEMISTVIKAEVEYGNKAYGPGFVSDLKIFKGRVPLAFSRLGIKAKNFPALMDFARSLYQDAYPGLADDLNFDDYWEPMDVFRFSKDLTAENFADWLREIFLDPQYYGDRTGEEEYTPTETGNFLLRQREEMIIQMDSKLRSKLFPPIRPVASVYCLTDAGNENTQYAPYLLIGSDYVIAILREWIL
jgi:hypothetical protein